MNNNYTVFHLHDDRSNCNGYADSCSNYKEYIKLAKKQGMKAIAFSNHGGIYDWVKSKIDCDKAGIKYIHGVELYLCTELQADERGYHIGLYAKNFDGVLELNKIMSKSTSKGKNKDNTDRHFYFNPRISVSELINTSDNIIITTACLASVLYQASIKPEVLQKKVDALQLQNIHLESKTNRKSDKPEDKKIVKEIKKNIKQINRIEKHIQDLPILREKRDLLLKWFSKNNHRCFLEIQYHDDQEQINYNKMLYKWSQEYNIPLIVGTDTHSSSEYKAKCRKILQVAKDSFYGNEDSFDLTWKTYDELVEKFKAQNSLPINVVLEAIENTNVLSDMIEDFKLDRSFKYPHLYGNNAIKLWKQTIFNKFKDKLNRGIIDKTKISKYKEKINEEFNAMKKLGMESFMLFMSELTDHCHENNIPYGFCRGSVGGSEIAYITDIIDVDPIEWGTVFSRFVNADRVSLGDVDLDFAPDDREKVYRFIMDKFTTQKTSYIVTMGTIKDRGTIDVLAKGLGYEDLDEVARIKDEFDKIYDEYCGIIQEEVNLEELDEVEGTTIDFDYHKIYCSRIRNNKALTRAKNLMKQFDELKKSNKDLFYYFDGLKGTIISKGKHPAGMIGSPITLDDNLGVFYKDGDENIPYSTCSMKPVDYLNFVKFDILGLKTVGILKDAYANINSHYLKSHEIDWNDEKVWKNMIEFPVGIFQFEGDYAFSLLKDFKPEIINHMSLVNAALRPSGKSYRGRLMAKEFNKNPSEEIDMLLEDNFGFLVYQEDTIKFLTDICDMSGAEADTTRRAIGKKDQESLKEQLPKILNGYCSHSNKPKEEAEKEAQEFLQIISDSSEYQFGYNHSTGYSMNGYACARLRTYYPLEFTTAYLNRAKTIPDIIKGTRLAEHLNIKIKPITYGRSIDKYTFNKKENTIYKGIESVKNLNSKIALELYELKDNQYDNFTNLLVDINEKTSTQKDQLEILVILNFFREFGKNKKLLKHIEIFNKFYGRKQINKNKDLDKLGITEDFIDKYSNKKTNALYKELDIIGIINELTKNIENKPLTIKQQVEYEFKFLEDTDYINKKASDNFYIITEYKTYKDKTKPYITLRQINSGENIKTKVKNGKYFSQNPFKRFDILKVEKFITQKKTKRINGEWKKSDEDEEILTEWVVY